MSLIITIPVNKNNGFKGKVEFQRRPFREHVSGQVGTLPFPEHLVHIPASPPVLRVVGTVRQSIQLMLQFAHVDAQNSIGSPSIGILVVVAESNLHMFRKKC